MNTKFCLMALFVFTVFHGQNNGIAGKWNAVDEETGKSISIIEIFEVQNKVYGKVFEIFNPKDRNRICVNCMGEDKNKPILGMYVIKGLQKEGAEYSNGKILDPKSGRLYRCYITLESKDKLKVRGYIGISLFGRTQYWYRVR